MAFLQLFYFLFFDLDLSESLIDLPERFSFLPELPHASTLPLSGESAQTKGLLIEPHPPLPSIALLQLYEVLMQGLNIQALLIRLPIDNHLLLGHLQFVHLHDLLLLLQLCVSLCKQCPQVLDLLLHQLLLACLLFLRVGAQILCFFVDGLFQRAVWPLLFFGVLNLAVGDHWKLMFDVNDWSLAGRFL